MAPTRDEIAGVIQHELWWDTYQSYGSICGIEAAADAVLALFEREATDASS